MGGRNTERETEWDVDPKFEGRDALAFIREFLAECYTTALLRVRVRDHDRAARYQEPDFWGYCYPPTKTLDGYRISVFVCGEDYHFPWCGSFGREQPPGYRSGAYGTHAGILDMRHVVRGLDEGLVWILGHELFHYVASTGQTFLAETERNADLLAYELLWAYREAEDPFYVWDALLVADGRASAAENFRYAGRRWPYTDAGRKWEPGDDVADQACNKRGEARV